MEETMNPVFISDKRFEERNIRCDQCSHYHMIDSGWGQCVESPPRAVVLGLFRNKIKWMHCEVPWCAFKCGKFISKEG